MIDEYETEDDLEQSRYIDFCMVGPSVDYDLNEQEDSVDE